MIKVDSMIAKDKQKHRTDIANHQHNFNKGSLVRPCLLYLTPFMNLISTGWTRKKSYDKGRWYNLFVCVYRAAIGRSFTMTGHQYNVVTNIVLMEAIDKVSLYL